MINTKEGSQKTTKTQRNKKENDRFFEKEQLIWNIIIFQIFCITFFLLFFISTYKMYIFTICYLHEIYIY